MGLLEIPSPSMSQHTSSSSNGIAVNDKMETEKLDDDPSAQVMLQYG